MKLAALRLTLLTSSLPLMMAAQGDGCAANSKSPAPDVAGVWNIEYDDQIGVEVKIGGAVYTAELGAQGGVVTIDHEGKPYQFDLDCSRPEIVCPSEAWPTRVVIEQRNERLEHQMIVNLPSASCDGDLAKPPASECGANTSNPNCDLVCEGDVTIATTETFGVIGETGDSFRLFLGGGIVTNGINCALLGYSLADANLVTENRNQPDWTATEMTGGLVTIGYAGGCLFVGDVNGEDGLVAVGAEVKFTTGFTGTR